MYVVSGCGCVSNLTQVVVCMVKLKINPVRRRKFFCQSATAVFARVMNRDNASVFTLWGFLHGRLGSLIPQGISAIA